MKKALVIGLVVTLVASLSLFAAAADHDYSLENGEATLSQTVSYSWNLDANFVADSGTTVASNDPVTGQFIVLANREEESNVLSFDLNLDVVGDGNAPGATVESMTVDVQVDTDQGGGHDWETVATYSFEPGNTVGEDDTDAIDQSFDLDLADLSEANRTKFDDADGYRLYATVAMDEDGDTFDLTDAISFDLPEEADVEYVDAEATFETDLFDALDDEGVDYGTTDEGDWEIDTNDDSVYGTIDLDLEAADGSYTVPVHVDLFGDDEDTAIASKTETLHLTYGDVVEPEGDQEQERDRDAWVDGHPVHGTWMPPVKDGMMLNGNRSLPVKFWLPEGEDYGDVGVVICALDDGELSDDCTDVIGLVQNGGGMYQAVVHLKGLGLDAGDYALVITDKDGDPLDLEVNGEEVDPITFKIVGKANGGKPDDVGITTKGNSNNGRGHGKDK